jgi:threonine dehydrogenase-like Zn-dependent dehydrogenase
VLTADWKPKQGFEFTDAEKRSGRVRAGNMVWHNPTLSVAERPDPVIASPHDVLIRNRACGICGSDVHMYQPGPDGYLDMPVSAAIPIAIGHEYAGEVVEVGPAVTRVKVGDPVAVEGQVNCGTCRACQRGIPSNCEFIDDHGFTLDGGTATLAVADEKHCWPLTAVAERFGEAHAYDVGAVTEPAAVVYNGMIGRAGGFQPGDSIAVFGCGPIGLAAVGLAGALGAGNVFAIEPAPAKREIASTLGATATFDPASGDPTEWLLEETGGIGIDMAVDASGVGRIVVPQILGSIAVGGKIVFLGVNKEPIELDAIPILIRSAAIFGAIAHLGGGFPATIALHAEGRLDLTKMITGRFPMEEGLAAMELTAKGEDAKVLIYPQGAP